MRRWKRGIGSRSNIGETWRSRLIVEVVHPETRFRRPSSRDQIILNRTRIVRQVRSIDPVKTDEIRQAIFEEFEEESSDEEEDNEDDEEDEEGLIAKTKAVELDDEEESGTGVLTSQLRHFVIQASHPPSVESQRREELMDRNTSLVLFYSI